MDLRGRTALVAAIAFSLPYGAGIVALGGFPKSSDSPNTIAGYFIDHSGQVRGAGYSFTLAGIAFIVVTAALRRRLVAVSGILADAGFAAAVLLAAAAIANAMVTLGLSLHAGSTDPGTLRALFDIGNFFAPVATTAVAVQAASVAIASLKHGALPRWLGVASAAYVAYQALESFTIYGTSGAFLAGGIINNIGTLLYLVWFIAVGACLSARSDVTADRG